MLNARLTQCARSFFCHNLEIEDLTWEPTLPPQDHRPSHIVVRVNDGQNKSRVFLPSQQQSMNLVSYIRFQRKCFTIFFFAFCC